MDPSGIFATSYGRDSALVRARAQWLALALFGAALLLAAAPWLVRVPRPAAPGTRCSGAEAGPGPSGPPEPRAVEAPPR